jgi:hypothetical protein
MPRRSKTKHSFSFIQLLLLQQQKYSFAACRTVGQTLFMEETGTFCLL